MITTKDKNLRKGLKNILQSTLYKLLTKREFRRTRVYPDFKDVAFDLATQFKLLTTNIRDYFHSSDRDFFGNEYVNKNERFIIQSKIQLSIYQKLCLDCYHLPVYACSPELSDLLQKTEPLLELKDPKEVFSSCLIVLPNDNNIFQSGNVVCKLRYLLLSYYPEGTYSTSEQLRTAFYNVKDPKIKITTDEFLKTVSPLDFSYHYCPTLYYTFLDVEGMLNESDDVFAFTDGCIQFNKGSVQRLSAPERSKEENQEFRAIHGKNDLTKVMYQIDDFVTNIYLYLQTENVNTSKKIDAIGFDTGKKKSKAQDLNLRAYIALDLPDKSERYILQNRGDRQFNHARPITHWRRGHWRNQPCGEKLQDSKIIWIQPTLINANVGE